MATVTLIVTHDSGAVILTEEFPTTDEAVARARSIAAHGLLMQVEHVPPYPLGDRDFSLTPAHKIAHLEIQVRGDV